MKIAILALTRDGKCLARSIADRLPGQTDLYFKEGYAVEGRECSFTSLSQLVQDLFKQYEGLIFVMAAGIVVRVIAPLLKNKALDPAVVVVDEKGSFAISLLSGHLGGANSLANQISGLIGAMPVITTASDVQGLPSIDLVAQKLGLYIEPFGHLKYINAAIVNREELGIYANIDKALLLKRCPELGIKDINIEPLEQFPNSVKQYQAVVVISDCIMPNIDQPVLFLRPRILSVGLGCRRGMPVDAILAAVKKACEQVGRSPGAIRKLATAWVKADEEGILQAGRFLNVPVQTFTKEQLQATIISYSITSSPYTLEKIGVGAVCEPTALLGAKRGRVILPKQKYNGITVAIAEESCPWWELDPVTWNI